VVVVSLGSCRRGCCVTREVSLIVVSLGRCRCGCCVARELLICHIHKVHVFTCASAFCMMRKLNKNHSAAEYGLPLPF